MPQYPSPVVRLWRSQPWSANPLMRASDRWEALVRLLAAVVVLIAVPVAGAAGTAGYTCAVARIRTENAEKVAVTATVTGEPERRVTAARYEGIQEQREAPVRWTYGDREHTATVEVPGATELGGRVTVWLGSDESVTTPPRPASDAAWAGILAGLAALAGICCAAVALVLTTSWLLGRMHSAAWESEWRRMSRPIGTDT
ncbi:Rv1733c family protein [Nocardia sp. R6R-6]|uniref:Rv1733c family protein n=1 Tax=Nocardia sp. R6R-6 TaxID=3459303 RepID=UPI00403D72C4